MKYLPSHPGAARIPLKPIGGMEVPSPEAMGAEASELRERIEVSLMAQGFQLDRGVVTLPADLSKDGLRNLHATAVEHKRQYARGGLFRKENWLLDHFASGAEVEPTKILPQLVEVEAGSVDELLFRYAALHWSIPISSGYGRRLRFIVVDKHNNKMIGIIGLGDPVYSLSARDQWIGWTPACRQTRLRNVMDAFVLGAVPPYSFLLGGKLVAMLAASDTVRNAFKRKYGGTVSRIQQNVHDGSLALITTTSALGRSSVYNRLRLPSGAPVQSVGYTKGSGEFHFTNGLYGSISKYVQEHATPTEKQSAWGKGFRNRREVVKKTLSSLGLSSKWLYHGIQREIFAVALAQNTREFLKSEASHLDYYSNSEDVIARYFRERWLLPRAAWDTRFREWTPDTWRLWPQKELIDD